MANDFLLGKVKKLLEKPESEINVLDIDHDVFLDKWDTVSRSTVEKNHYARLNAYRMWLKSKKYDYNRRPDVGGLFSNNLNDVAPLAPENEQLVKDLIVSETNKQFPLLKVLDCQVKAHVAERRWEVKIRILDESDGAIMEEIDDLWT